MRKSRREGNNLSFSYVFTPVTAVMSVPMIGLLDQGDFHMAGPESHIPVQDLQDAVAWDRKITQTVAKIHDEVTHNDAAGLRKTVAQIDVGDLSSVQVGFKDLYGKPLKDVVASDEKLPPAARTFVTEQLNRKVPTPTAARDDGKYPAIDVAPFRQASALAFLGSGAIAIEQYRLQAQVGAHEQGFGKMYLPVSHGETAQTALTAVQKGAQDRQAAESGLRNTIASYSPGELRAIEEYSLTHATVPGHGVLEELAGDTNFSTETRSFIADLSKKR
jgi:hypothetical protein